MVREQRYLFDVADISALLYTCHHCGQEIAVRIEGDYSPPDYCPGCSESLSSAVGKPETPDRILLVSLRRILKRADPPARVRFVVVEAAT